MTPDQHCAAIARLQSGLINRAQAFAAGLDRSCIVRRLQTGRWRMLLPNVYCINGTPRSWEQQAMAACLWAGEDAAVSYCAAARLWGLSGFAAAGVEISTAKPKWNVHVGFRIHRVRKELTQELDTIKGIPVTSIRWTLLDLAGVKHASAERALDQALARELTSLGQMWRLYEEQWTRGRRGIAILRSFLKERTPGNAPDDSELERLFDGIVRDFLLPEPSRQFCIDLPNEHIRVDYCYPESKLIIEVDGFAFHSSREAFESDRVRDNQLQLLGWRVLRFTWAQLRFEREEVATMIKKHLEPSHRVMM